MEEKVDHPPNLKSNMHGDPSDEETVSDTPNVADKAPPPADYPESVFKSSLERWQFVVVISLAAWISTVSIPIYFPTLNLLADYFDVSVSKINVTATVYSIFQGVSPIFWAPLSDSWGRRPVYLCCALCYIASNIALACATNYGQLLGLRILQAFGGATTVSLLGGVIGDITLRKNRGKLIGVGQGISLIGNCFGPLVGSGIQTQFDSWRAIFWTLAILGGIIFLLIFFLLPETNRRLVGTGARAPPSNWKYFMSRSIYVDIRRRLTGLPLSRKDPENEKQWKLPYKSIRWFRWAELFFQPRILLCLIPAALHYTTWYMVLTAQSTVLSEYYHFTTRQIGYTYLASGIGTLVASVGAGELMHYKYRREARYAPLDIYRARLGYSFHASAMLVISTLIFGWTLHFHESFYVPVVMTFFVSIGSSFFMSTISAILVDLFPADSAASQSCNNLARCLLCAAGLAAVQSMMDGMTIGGTFTFMAGLCALSMACVWYAMLRHGYRRKEQRFIEAPAAA